MTSQHALRPFTPLCHLLGRGQLPMTAPVLLAHHRALGSLSPRPSLPLLAAPKWALSHSFMSGGLVDKISKLEAVLSKEFTNWTPLERQMYKNPVNLFEKIERLEQELVSLRKKEAALAKQKSNREELLVLREKNVPEIKTLDELKAIPGLVFKDTPSFPFLTTDVFETSVDRDQEIEAIFRFLLKREPLFGNSTKEDLRNFNKILCIVGAPGTGKSHVLDYLERKINSIELDGLSQEEKYYYLKVKEMLRESVFMRITLNTETTYDPDEDLNYVLSSRLLCGYFIEGLESDKFNAICRCTLENAIGIIVKHSRKKHAFLILDEVNRLSNERSAENPSSPFHILMARISGLIDKAKEPRVNFLCSSLASIPIRDMETLSGRRYQEYALQQIVSVDKLFANMALTDNGKALIKIAGGHCRTLENVQRVLENNPQEDRLPELLTLLGEEQKVSMTDLETAKPVLRSTISGIAVGLRRIIMVAGSSSYSADALRAYGYCSFLHSTKDYEMVIPALTPYQLVLYFSSLDAVLGEQFRDSFRSRKDQCNFGGIVFEKFHVAFECFRRMLFANEKLERLTSSSIRQFYGKDDACFSSDFDECSMSLHDKYIFEDVPQSKFTRHFVSSGFLTGAAKDCLSDGNARVMRFSENNPAFDALIISPLDETSVHLTFIESRYSQQLCEQDEPNFSDKDNQFLSKQGTDQDACKKRQSQEKNEVVSKKNKPDAWSKKREEKRSPLGPKETVSSYKRKHNIMLQAVSKLHRALGKKNGQPIRIKWHYVYALYREHDLKKEHLLRNTILLDRKALNHFYGPSLSGLGMFLKDKRSPEDPIQELD